MPPSPTAQAKVSELRRRFQGSGFPSKAPFPCLSPLGPPSHLTATSAFRLLLRPWKSNEGTSPHRCGAQWVLCPFLLDQASVGEQPPLRPTEGPNER